MGNNNYQFRLQSLDVLDDYRSKLSKEQETINNLGFVLTNLHGSYADEDRWNDIKHSQFENMYIAEIRAVADSLREKIAEAVNQLDTYKGIYSNAGIV
jgi:hypothetical protein